MTLALLGLGLAAIVVFILYLRWNTAEKRAAALATQVASQAASAEREIERLRQEVTTLQAELSRLSKWQAVADADAAAAEMLAAARAEATRIVNEAAAAQESASTVAASVRKMAEQEAANIRQEARDRLAKESVEAAARLNAAEAQAASLIADANRKAEEIGGDAVRALREARELEASVEAMENLIKGYGDRYIVPTHTLLDDLADSFGHTEAGQQLKVVRERIRDAVRGGSAAVCDYVEDNRRGTAIRFVVDAFNGKADSILAKVRHDNFGTLRQQLQDAFAIVNQNGRAFRNARVTESYLALRAEELRWASIVNRLKEDEREEQRRIKEQLREEEQARKEYERALREAARDEEALRKAMAKANQQLERATAEQKEKYEAQLRELEERLKAAEERSQRAVSMAQQTRRGHVYIISNVGSFGENVYKIGLTRRLEPVDRIRELGDSSVPFDFDVHALIFSEDAPALETRLHRHFLLNQVNKVNYRKEFFRVSLADIRRDLEAAGVQASWTMTAAAREYHESQAIEKSIQDDPIARETWLRRQMLLEPVTAVEDTAAVELA